MWTATHSTARMRKTPRHFEHYGNRIAVIVTLNCCAAVTAKRWNSSKRDIMLRQNGS
jgi:hypothetical protein